MVPMNVLPAGMWGTPDVQVGVRPEHLRIDPVGRLRAVVRQIEHLGHEVLVVADADGHRVVARVAPTSAVPSVGESVAFDADPSRLHRFNAVSGERVE